MLVMLPASAQKLIAEKTVVDVGKTGFQQPITAVFEFRNKNAKRLRIEAVYCRGISEGCDRHRRVFPDQDDL